MPSPSSETLHLNLTAYHQCAGCSCDPPPAPPGHCPPAGFAERALVDYCISLGKKAKDAGSLASTLEGQVGTH